MVSIQSLNGMKLLVMYTMYMYKRTFLTVHSSQILFKILEGAQCAAVLFYFILICWIIFSVSTARYFSTQITTIR